MKKKQKQQPKTSTQGLTDDWDLVKISELIGDEEKMCWKIRCLGIKDKEGKTRSPVYDELKKWRADDEKEFEKLLRSIRYAAANQVHQNQDKVRQDRKKRGGYELKATSCKCRVMFFYHKEESQLIICTNSYWKGKGAHDKDQDIALGTCAKIKESYLATKGKK